jgi:hypothetical protein
MKALDAPRDAKLAGAVVLTTALLGRQAFAASGKLLVFLHVAVKQRALQSELRDALPGVDVIAVGRVADFERALRDAVDAVLALPHVLAANSLSPSLQGQRAGSSEEAYSLIGVGAAPDPARVKTVGALNVLGRDGTQEFVRGLVGASPKVERVSKFEDLLPLLQLQRADAVLLPTWMFSGFKSGTKLELVARELTRRKVGLPAAASLTPSGAQVVSALGKIPARVSRILGVDQWR